MVLFVLCLFLLINCMVFYKVFGRRLLSPSVIVNFVFLFSCVFLLFYSSALEFEMDIKTAALILFANYSISIGEYFANRLKGKQISDSDYNFYIPRWLYFVGFVIVSLSFLFYLRDVIQLSINYYGSATGFIENMKILKMKNEYNVGFLAGQGYLASEVIADIFLFALLKSIVFDKKMIKNPFLYLTVLVYIMNILITATRSRLLNLFIYFIVALFILIYSRRNKVTKKKHVQIRKALVIVTPLFAILLLGFYFAGSLTGKMYSYNNIGENLLNYCGMSIYNLNYYLTNTNASIFNSGDSFFGIHTLSGPYTFLRSFGFDIPQDIVALEYIQSNLVLGNVFTPLRRYFQDFGLMGVFFISSFLGFLYSFLITKSINNNRPIIVMLTAYFIYPLFFWSIEERFFMDVLLIIRTIYTLIYFGLFSFIFLKRRKITRPTNIGLIESVRTNN